MAFNAILESLGGVGYFQILHTILLLIPVALVGCHNLLQNFTGAVPSHHCRVPLSIALQYKINSTRDAGQEKLLRSFIPLDEHQKLEKCVQYRRNKGWSYLLNATLEKVRDLSREPCKDGWIYDTNVFSSTIVTEWNLVCSQRSWKQVAHSIYMTGVLIGAVVFGSLADKFGRMEILTWSYLQMGIAGCCAAFLPTFDAYCAFRFLCGVASSAVSVNSISLILEWMPNRGRTLAGNFFGFSYSVGQLLLAAIAYNIRNWRWLQFAVSAPFCVFFIYSWWLPESARWLILRDRPHQAVENLRKAARFNGKLKEGKKLNAEWNLVCSQRSWKQVAHSIYMTGVLIGAVVFGSLADKFGRMEILTWSYLQMGIAGCCAAFLPTFDAYCAFRFLCGVASSAVSVNSISLILEWMPNRGRTLAGNFFGFSYSVGQLLLAAIAYNIRNWRWLQFAVSAPFCVFFIYSWWLPESARWLILRDRPHQAVENLRKAARFNGKLKEGKKLNAEMLCSEMQKEILEIRSSHSVLDLVRTPAMRRMSTCLLFVWLSSNFAYYGLSMDLQNFGLSVFLAQALFGGVEMAAKVIVMVSMTVVGRRVMQFWSLIFAGALVISYGFVPPDMRLLCTVLAVTGKAFLASSITCMYLFTGELYPTEIRQTGMGFSAMNARLGSAIASVVHLTGDFSLSLFSMVFGVTPIVAGLFSCFLLETKDSPLRDTIHDVERRYTNQSMDSDGSEDDEQNIF
ncbi:solute carrier family 22 member 20 [Pelobates cultripes]|uniref:Solute carrier family 22 member 20 n=1 Tax=Pelobates cultripes TaxID=61616 RepID=A0AAD1TEG8_PELCU|nr:solute carrier family 22 member 20 [Pelobates cultripes]